MNFIHIFVSYFQDKTIYGASCKNKNAEITQINYEKDFFIGYCLLDGNRRKSSSVQTFQASGFVENFMKSYDVKDKRLAIVILYHEYMYDLLDVLVEKGTIELPKLCTSKIKNPKDAAKQVFIQKQTE